MDSALTDKCGLIPHTRLSGSSQSPSQEQPVKFNGVSGAVTKEAGTSSTLTCSGSVVKTCKNDFSIGLRFDNDMPSTHPLERVRLKYEGVSIFLAQLEEEVAYMHTHPVSLTIAATGTRETTHAGTSSPR